MATQRIAAHKKCVGAGPVPDFRDVGRCRFRRDPSVDGTHRRVRGNRLHCEGAGFIGSVVGALVPVVLATLGRESVTSVKKLMVLVAVAACAMGHHHVARRTGPPTGLSDARALARVVERHVGHRIGAHEMTQFRCSLPACRERRID